MNSRPSSSEIIPFHLSIEQCSFIRRCCCCCSEELGLDGLLLLLLLLPLDLPLPKPPPAAATAAPAPPVVPAAASRRRAVELRRLCDDRAARGAGDWPHREGHLGDGVVVAGGGGHRAWAGGARGRTGGPRGGGGARARGGPGTGGRLGHRAAAGVN